jgi:arginyl-tRNA synthetase
MIEQILSKAIAEAIRHLFDTNVDASTVPVQKTRREFTGDYTVVVFPFVKIARKSPEDTGNMLGSYLEKKLEVVSGFNVIKGFLNFEISDSYWLAFFNRERNNSRYGIATETSGNPVVIEYSSPNTNKPLHLGHIRNNLLGFSLARILAASGQKVMKVNLVNDRGIHICKSMLAWQKWGNGETPQSSGLKGDHLVGKYYVLFDKHYKAEIADLVKNGMDEELAEKEASLLMEAQEMLLRWEEQNPEVRALWETMNSWVYQGFADTYERLGVDFDKVYYESDTYLLGRDIVKEGLQKGVFIQKENGSVWCDLSDEGLDEKLLLRKDGTSVYMTQDLGTATLRQEEFDPDKLIYVVGNEQNYHFDVLKKILLKLGFQWAENIFHLSYGMVELPHGRMKSREGTVVDADDLMQEMVATAKKTTEELGKTNDFSPEEKAALFEIIGKGALKYYILKVDPRKTILFNPEESIDFNGNTGPFIQYTHARIRSLVRKAKEKNLPAANATAPEILHEKEKEILKMAAQFPATVLEAAHAYSPATIANYTYELAKEFNQMYQSLPVLRDTDSNTATFRLGLAVLTGNILKNAMNLLGIDVPEKM